MNLEIEKVASEAIASMQQEYLATLTAPMDCFWQEGLIAAADHHLILIDGEQAGYFVANASKQMMQYHVTSPFLRGAPEIFSRVLANQQIKTAVAATIEPMYFGLCLDAQKESRVHTYLFSDHQQKEPVIDSIQGHQFR